MNRAGSQTCALKPTSDSHTAVEKLEKRWRERELAFGTDSAGASANQEVLGLLASEKIRRAVVALNRLATNMLPRASTTSTSKKHNIAGATEFLAHIASIDMWLPTAASSDVTTLVSLLMLATVHAAERGVMSDAAHSWLGEFTNTVKELRTGAGARSRDAASQIIGQRKVLAALTLAIFALPLAHAISAKLTGKPASTTERAVRNLLASAGFRNAERIAFGAAHQLILSYAEAAEKTKHHNSTRQLAQALMSALDPTGQYFTIPIHKEAAPRRVALVRKSPSAGGGGTVCKLPSKVSDQQSRTRDEMLKWIAQYDQPTSQPLRQIALAAAAPRPERRQSADRNKQRSAPKSTQSGAAKTPSDERKSDDAFAAFLRNEQRLEQMARNRNGSATTQTRSAGQQRTYTGEDNSDEEPAPTRNDRRFEEAMPGRAIEESGVGPKTRTKTPEPYLAHTVRKQAAPAAPAAPAVAPARPAVRTELFDDDGSSSD
jgi:hypothetical protein